MIRQSLKVSLSTDAVIYLPFYLAYFGGEFADTPFGPVDVKIVGLEDPLFNSADEQKVKNKTRTALKPRLRGDLAMTADVLLEVADIGIGDPGFACIMKTEKKELYKKFFNKAFFKDYIQFFDLRQFDADSCVRQLANTLGNSIDQVPEFIDEQLKRNKDLRILAGLIRKPGLKAIVGQSKDEFFKANTDLNEHVHKEKDLLRSQLDDLKKKYSIFTYPTPATSAQYVEQALDCKIGGHPLDFGAELQNLKKNEICLSCDFVALDYLHEREDADNYIIDDLVTSGDMLMWSGFVADYSRYEKDKKKYRAFAYAIDKVLHEFNAFVENRDRLGLEKYIYNMLSKDQSNRAYIISVLIADSQIASKFSERMNNPLMQITRQIADNIFRWRGKTVSMYYASSRILSGTEMARVRKDKHFRAHFDAQNFAHFHEISAILELRKDQDAQIEHMVFPDVLCSWRRIEKRIIYIRKRFKWVFQALYNNNFWESIAIVFAFLSLLAFVNGLFDPIFTGTDRKWELYILGGLGLLAGVLFLLRTLTRKYMYVYGGKQ